MCHVRRGYTRGLITTQSKMLQHDLFSVVVLVCEGFSSHLLLLKCTQHIWPTQRTSCAMITDMPKNSSFPFLLIIYFLPPLSLSLSLSLCLCLLHLSSRSHTALHKHTHSQNLAFSCQATQTSKDSRLKTGSAVSSFYKEQKQWRGRERERKEINLRLIT